MNHPDRSAPAGPPLGGLGPADLDAIHEASMQVIEEVGIQLNHPRARRLFAECGATVHDDQVVTIPRAVIEDHVDRAPDEFTLHARNPENDVTVGGDSPPLRAPAYGPATVCTYQDGRRAARLDDYETLLKLAQAEDAITCTGYSLCEPTDVEESVKHYELVRRALTMTDKPVMGPTYGAERAEAAMDMVGIAVDDPELSKPYVAGLINTVPPRRIDTEMLGGLLTYADHGQPLVVSSFTMAGASGPATLPAAMAQTNAENLVGIALAQLVNPGTPVVYGVPTSNVDGRYGSLSIGSPESALFVAFAAQMGTYYGLPSRGGGGLSDAKLLDYQSGFESMFVQAVTAFSGVDYVLNSAGVLESYSAVSPEKFVLDCEALRYLDRFGDGVSLQEGAFRLDRMAEVDPGGHFLDPEGREDTFYHSTVADKRAHGTWAEDGGKSAATLAHERVGRLLDAYDRPPMDDAAERTLQAYVDRHAQQPL